MRLPAPYCHPLCLMFQFRETFSSRLILVCLVRPAKESWQCPLWFLWMPQGCPGKTHPTCIMETEATEGSLGASTQGILPGSYSFLTQKTRMRASEWATSPVTKQQAGEAGLNKQESTWSQEDWKCRGVGEKKGKVLSVSISAFFHFENIGGCPSEEMWPNVFPWR